MTVMNSRRDFYSKLLAQKNNELAAIESQLSGTLSHVDELKLVNQAEDILKKIEELDKKLKKLDGQDKNSNVRHLNLEKSFQKIDNECSKEIAKSVNIELGDKSGAILLFLQRFTKQKGIYCLNEVLDLMISDRKIGDDIIGDFRPYPIDLGSAISEFNENEFSKRLASHLSSESEVPLSNSIKTLCSSLKGGSTIFIQIENWDSVLEKDIFLKWFIEEFWQTVIFELEPIFQEYSKIRFIVALVAKSQVFPDCSSLDYFCKNNPFDYRKIIELPLPDWKIEDIKNWLINFQGFSNTKSLQWANRIYHESEGTPNVVCSILEDNFLKQELKV
jgi:Effector-associated domain 9/inactive STAND